jgi:dsRNA-specific ribonuclease
MNSDESVCSNNSNEGDGKIKINPYNVNNKLISNIELSKILTNCGIDLEINNLELYRKAFAHKSYCKKKNNDNDVEIAERPENALELREESNERLEFLGDSIISSVVAKYLFERYPDQDEGFMTRIRTKLVNGQSLGNFANIIGLPEFLIISRHVEERCKGRENYRILEDAFESFIGALFLDFNEIELEDFYKEIFNKKSQNNIENIRNNLNEILKSKLSKHNKEKIMECLNEIQNIENVDMNFNGLDFSGPGYQICQLFIINIIEDNVCFQDLILKDTNFKDQLLRYFQHNYQITPKYKEENIDGPPHNRIFTMSVSGPNGNVIGTGKGRSKKKAEQKASKFALIYLGEISADAFTDEDNDSNDE